DNQTRAFDRTALRQQRADLALQRRGELRFASASFASFHNMAKLSCSSMAFLVRPSVFVFMSPQFAFLFVRWLQAQCAAMANFVFHPTDFFAYLLSTMVIVKRFTSTVHPSGVSAPCDAARLRRSRTVCLSVIFFALYSCAFRSG